MGDPYSPEGRRASNAKFFLIGCLGCAGLAAIVCAFGGFAAFRGYQSVASDVTPAADRVFAALKPDWSYDRLAPLADGGLRTTDEKTARNLFAGFRKTFGDLRAHEEWRVTKVEATTGEYGGTLASVVARAKAERGDPILALRFRRVGKEWKLLNLRVSAGPGAGE